jgi:hypothetical protein
MKTSNILMSAAIAAITFSFISCGKNNSNSESGIKYKVQTTNRTSVVGRVAAGNIQWISGYGYATEIKFEAEANNREVEFRTQIPQRIDLFTGITTLGNITLPPGTYDEVEFKVELNANGSNSAFEVSGQFTSGSTITPVVFSVNTPLEIETEKNNVVITDNNSYSALTTLDLSLLTRGVTESMLNNAVRTNGTILITSAINANIYNIILNNLTDCDDVDFEDD